MAKTASLHIRLDEKIKADTENLFKNFGMSVTDAINIFLHTSLMVGGLPFEVRKSTPNAETLAAIKEVEDMKSGKIPKVKMSVSDFFKEMGE